MALSPLQSREERFASVRPAAAPSRTYRFDIDTGELASDTIDGNEAVKQFVLKAIRTARYRYLIYDGQYGCELERLLGQDISQELLKSEIVRVLSEALMADDRVRALRDFQIARAGDRLFVTFTVVTAEGTIVQEVNL